MLLEALPIEVKESVLTDAQKKVLNVLFTYNTLDKSLENGWFYISNERLRKESEIGSKSTINSVISFLISNNFIDRKAGKQCPNGGVASTYTLKKDNIMNWSKENKKKIKKLEEIKAKMEMGTPNKKISTPTEKMGTPTEKMGTPLKCTDVKCTDVIMTELMAIRQENRELKQMLECVLNQLKISTPLKCTDVKCTTDIDIDKEIININNTLVDHIASGPVENEEIDIDNVVIKSDKENKVCDSDEQREEEITNANSLHKQQELNNDNSNDESFFNNGNSNNNKPYSSTISVKLTPQPPTETRNANKAVLSHETTADNKSISRSDETQQDANKRANLGHSDTDSEFRNEVRQEYKRIIGKIKGNYSADDIVKEMESYFELCRNCNDWNLCCWWYDTLEHIIKKFGGWYENGSLDNVIYYVANEIMENKK